MISARAPKLAIRWKSMPMAIKRSLVTNQMSDYGALAHSRALTRNLCDGLSRYNSSYDLFLHWLCLFCNGFRYSRYTRDRNTTDVVAAGGFGMRWGRVHFR